MPKTIQFNSFQTTYNKLLKNAINDLTKVNIQYFHHDFQSEPFLHVEAKVENVMLEHVETHGLVITVLTPETTFTFTERNYYTNLSNDAVVFSSKNDGETYCIIEFI
ncbi:hypothetical protein [Ornithinibacillus sp. JPR2-1]|uniref:hypothetical protein n=1 Tax=Ornithinibacillus sp. JPR2-1 TaxID=2094019 RepID=UPI0031D7551A